MNNEIYNVKEKNDIFFNQTTFDNTFNLSFNKKIILEIILNEYNNNMKKIYSSFYETLNNIVIKSVFDYEDDSEYDYESIKNTLEMKMNSSEVEWGTISEFDEYVIENIKNENVLKALNQIYVDNFDNENVLVKILNAISEIDYNKINPLGQTIAIAAISNKNLVVKQKAIETFERWKNKDSIKILEQVDIREKWLKRYVEKVIADLREEVKDYA